MTLPDGSRWIDSDMHLAEPGNLWDAYIDPAYREIYPRGTRTDASYNSLLASPGAAPVHLESPAAKSGPDVVQLHSVGAAAIKR